MRQLRFLAVVGCMLALMAMPAKAQKWEHLADTPQMGWSTWNKFQGNISEDIVKGIADAMVESGLRETTAGTGSATATALSRPIP